MGKLTARLTTLLLAVLLSAIGAAAQGYHFQGFALGSDGLPAGQVTITVCASGSMGIPCSPTVTIYSNAAMTQVKANPFTTTPTDHSDFDFYVPPGSFTYTITGVRLIAPGESFSITAPCVPGSSCAAPTLPLSIANGGIGASSLAAAGIPVQTGTITAGDCVKWATTTSITDAGAACGSGSGGASLSTANTWTATQSFQPASGDALDILNSGGSTIAGWDASGNLITAQNIYAGANPATSNLNVYTSSYMQFLVGGSVIAILANNGLTFNHNTNDMTWLSPGSTAGNLTSASLTATRTWTLPDASGTVCIAGAGTSGCGGGTSETTASYTNLLLDSTGTQLTTILTPSTAGLYRVAVTILATTQAVGCSTKAVYFPEVSYTDADTGSVITPTGTLVSLNNSATGVVSFFALVDAKASTAIQAGIQVTTAAAGCSTTPIVKVNMEALP